MAQVAWQERAEFESDIIRRLVARPLRATAQDPASTATIISMVPAANEDEDDGADEDASLDVVRLKTEVTLMKAVLKAERSENASLRSRIENVAGPSTSTDDVRRVRDRWATLVDQLIRQPR